MNDHVTYRSIVDDNSSTRPVLKNRLQELQNTSVLFEAGDGQDFLNKRKSTSIIPHTCILYVKMPVQGGYETIKIMQRSWPSVKTPMMSQYCRPYALEKMIADRKTGIISKKIGLLGITEPVKQIMRTISI